MPNWLRRFVFVFCCVFALWGIRVFAQAGPTLRLSKSAVSSIKSGETITYTLLIENGYDEVARDVVVDDNLPAGVTFAPGSASSSGTVAGSRISFRLGSIAAGARKKVTYGVQVPFAAKAGSEIKSSSAVLTCSLGSAASGGVKTTVATLRRAAATGPGVIVFATRRDPATERQIYSINADGSNLTQLTNDNSLYHSHPALSADGTKIVFLGATLTSDSPPRINRPHLYVMNAQPQSATNQPIQLTNSTAGLEPSADSDLAWSPNNQQVIYSDAYSFHYVADLTPQTSSHGPIILRFYGGNDCTFSPDGTHIVFTRYNSASDNEIETVRLDIGADGKVLGNSDAEVVLLKDNLVKSLPTYSPDGSQIAFVQRNSASGFDTDLYVIDVSTKAVTRLTTNQNVFEHGNGATSWSPDGSLITFGSDGPGRKPDGTFTGTPTTSSIDGVYTIRPVPTTDENGDNFPSYLSSGNTGYWPKFAQVKSEAPTGLTGTLLKKATATSDESADPISSIPQGGTFFYHISWNLKNNDSSTVSGVTIRDQIPAQTTLVAGGDSTVTDSGGAKFVVFNVGAIAPNSSVFGVSTFSVKVDATAKVDDVILNPGSRYFAQSGSTQILGSIPVSVKVTAGAPNQLALTNTLLSVDGKAVTKQDMALGQGTTVLYLLSFANQGSAAATNLVATDTIPANTTLKGAYFSDASGNSIKTPTGYGYQFGSGKATFTIKNLASGAKAYAVVGVTIADNTANNTTLRNAATLKADNVALKTVNRDNKVFGVESFVFQKLILLPDGTTTPGNTATPGDTVRYLFHYVNQGNRVATKVVINDPTPVNSRGSAVDFTDSKGAHVTKTDGSSADITPANGTVSNGGATFKIPRLAPGEGGYVTFTVLINNDAASKSSTITNRNYSLATGEGFGVSTVPEVVTNIRAPLTISKKLALLNASPYNGTDKVRSGDLLTYNITVSNPSGNGAVTANNLTVTDFIPLDTTFKNVATGGTFHSNNPPFVSYSIASLAVGQSKTLQFSVTVDASAGTSIINRDYGVQIQGINKRFTGAPVTTPVFVAPALKVSRIVTVIETGSTTQVAKGQTLREVVTVTNTGGTAFTSSSVKVQVAPETALSKAFLGTTSNPVSGAAPLVDRDGKSVFFSLGKLAVGASASVTLETQVKFLTSATSLTLASDGALASPGDGDNPFISATDAPITLKIGGTGPPRPYLFLVLTPSLGSSTEEALQGSPGDKLTLNFNYVNSLVAGKGSTTKGTFISALLPFIATTNGTVVTPTVVSSTVPYTLANDGLLFKLGDLAAGSPAQNLKVVVSIPTNATVGKTIEFSGTLDAANYGSPTRDSAQLKIVTSPKIDLGVALDGSATASQPHTADGRLKPGAVINYQVIASNGGDGQASGPFLRVPIPAGTTYVPGSVQISQTLGTIHSGGTGTESDQTGKIIAIRCIPAEPLEKNDGFAVSFAVRINSDAPQSLTEIKNLATLSAFAPNCTKQTVTSNTDTQSVFIPPPTPANLTIAYERSVSFGIIGKPFTTKIIITNMGQTPAHNILIRYALNYSGVKNEIYISSTDGGTGVGPERTPSTVVWDGQGSSQASKFATLKQGEEISVSMTSSSRNDNTLKVLTGNLVDVHELDPSGTPLNSAERNPITRKALPNLTLMASNARTALRSAKSIRSAASTPAQDFFDKLGAIFNTIGANVGSFLFGGNASPAVQTKVESLNLLTSHSFGSAGEDCVVLTQKDGHTVKVTVVISALKFRVEGPSDAIALVASGGGNVISNDGGSLVASGGGNAISLDTAVGRLSVSQIFSKLLSQDGGGLRSSSEIYAGGSGTLISQDGGGLISQDGGGLVVRPAWLVASGGGNLVASGGGNLVNIQGNDFHSISQSSLVASGGGNLVASGGGNLVASGGGNLIAAGQLLSQDGGGLTQKIPTQLITQDGGGLVASGGGN